MKKQWIISIALIALCLMATCGQAVAAHYVCIANRHSDTVTALGVAGGNLISTQLSLDDGVVLKGNGFFGVAVAPDGKIYTANPSANAVYVTQMSNGEFSHTQTIADVGKKPLGVAASPEGRFVYVTLRGNGKLSVIDADYDPPRVITPRINVGNQPMGVAVSPDGNTVYVVNAGGEPEEDPQEAVSGSLWAISAFSGAVLWKVLDLGNNPEGLAVSHDGQRIYVANAGDDNLSVIDTVAGQEETGRYTRIRVGKNPVGVTVSPDDTFVFVADSGDDTVSVIRTADSIGNFYRLEDVDVATHPVGVSVTPDGAYVYVTCRGDVPEGETAAGGNGLAVIQTSDWSVTQFTDEDGLQSPASFGQFIGSISPPAAPSDFSLTAVSDTAITLSWTDNASDESGYKVYREPGPCGTDPFADAEEPHATLGANVISFEDVNGLEESSTYCYQVLAYNTTGSSTPSAAAEAITYPAAPSELMAVPASTNRIDLYWTDNSSKEDGFVIQRKPGPTATEGFETVGIVSADGTTYSDADHVRDASTYTYRVYAYDQWHFQGTTALDKTLMAYSAEQTATTPLAAPTGLSIADSSSKSIELSWRDNSSAESGYHIERKTVSDSALSATDDTSSTDSGSYTVIDSVGANVTGYEDSDVQANTEYAYRVQAYSGDEVSGYSNETQGEASSGSCFISTACFNASGIHVVYVTAASLVFLILLLIGLFLSLLTRKMQRCVNTISHMP